MVLQTVVSKPWLEIPKQFRASFSMQKDFDIFEKAYGAPRPTESQNPPNNKNKLQKPENLRESPKSKRYLPKSKESRRFPIWNSETSQKAADVWKKDVWDFQVFSQTFFELRFSLGNEGKDGKNLNSQTWPGTPRRPSPRHPRSSS